MSKKLSKIDNFDWKVLSFTMSDVTCHSFWHPRELAINDPNDPIHLYLSIYIIADVMSGEAFTAFKSFFLKFSYFWFFKLNYFRCI